MIKLKKMSKFIYVTSTALGTIAIQDLGYTHNFETVPHEMRVHEIICNTEGFHTVGPEEVRMLYLLPNNTETNSFTDVKQIFASAENNSNITVVDVGNEYPGYSNSVITNMKEPFRKTRIADFVESSSTERATFNEVDELIEKVNKYLLQNCPRWGRNDTAPQLSGRNKVLVTPGRLRFRNQEDVHLIPLFGPRLREILGLYDHGSAELKKGILDFIQGRETFIENALVSEDHFIDHYFTVRCDIVKNKLNQGMTNYGILFSWLKDPERQIDVNHIVNTTDGWIPVEQGRFKELRIIIGTSTNRLASFVDDYTLIVIEIRPVKS